MFGLSLLGLFDLGYFDLGCFDVGCFDLGCFVLGLFGDLFVGLDLYVFVVGVAGPWVAAHFDLEQWAQGKKEKTWRRKKKIESEKIPESCVTGLAVTAERGSYHGEDSNTGVPVKPKSGLRELYEMAIAVMILEFLHGLTSHQSEEQRMENVAHQTVHVETCIFCQSRYEDRDTHFG